MAYTDPEAARRYAKAYYAIYNPKHRKELAANTRRYRLAHPEAAKKVYGTFEERQARRAARVLGSWPCEGCGASPTHRHHYRGYARENWLDVVCLCSECHGSAHKEEWNGK